MEKSNCCNALIWLENTTFGSRVYTCSVCNNPCDMHKEEARIISKFVIGDKAFKPKGYKFNSVIVAVFKNLSGETRIVAENGDGLLHIFNENNLEKL